MTERSLFLQPKGVALVCFALLAGFTLKFQLLFWPFVTDDAYITFRYAERLLAGEGLTFNPGDRVEGFSNPLWLFLLAGTKYVFGGDIINWARGLGLFFAAGTLLALWWTVGSFRAFALALALLLVTPGFQVYASLGMEVPLLMFLLMLGVGASVRASPEKPYLILLAAFCFGLAGITRPEGLFYAALWGLGLVWHWRGRPLCWLFAAGGVTLAPALAYQLFRIRYYGEWLPNTAIAKSVAGLFGNMPWLTEWLQWCPTLLLLALIPLACGPSGDEREVRRLRGLALGPILAGVVFTLYAGSDWMMFGRFFLPVWPLVVCVLSVYCAGRSRCIGGEWKQFVVMLFVVLGSLAGWLGTAIPFLSNQTLASMLMRGQDQVAVGTWLAETYPQPLTVATNRIGAVSYYAKQHTVRDFLGLTDMDQARAIRASRGGLLDIVTLSSQNPILQQKPDILLVTRSPVTGTAPPYSEGDLRLLEPDYALVRRFPQGKWGTFDVWAKHGLTGIKPNLNN